MNGIIERIRVYPAKGDAGRELAEAALIENLGLEGDFHAADGARQVSVLFAETRNELAAQKEQGLCFSRFRENITLRSNLPQEDLSQRRGDAEGNNVHSMSDVLRSGMRFTVGEAGLEIADEVKRCHEECPLHKAGRQCPLAAKNLFAKVVKSGIIRVGDVITT
ncbi:MAG: hypothetical protein FWC24_01810 [Treponema sp.]|nr:hypothetical protein [Treponema sp.]